jgi:protein tyrosine phosphatase type 4A
MTVLADTTVTRRSNDKYHHHKHVNTPLGHTLSIIEHPLSITRYLILDCPTESTLSLYVEEFKALQVSTVVRCCQPTYSSQKLLENGISLVDMPFKDGGIVSISV